MTDDPTTVAKLDELLTAIQGYDDPRRAATEWKQVYKLLQKAGLPSGRFAGIVGMRDAAGLVELIDQLRNPAAATQAIEAAAIDADTCKRAMRAFRKRQSLTRLDDESKLGRGPLSKGSDDSFAAIVPPHEWPEPVWQELVRQGKLRYIGHGFYELPKDQPSSD
jgi:hypothetical protein